MDQHRRIVLDFLRKFFEVLENCVEFHDGVAHLVLVLVHHLVKPLRELLDGFHRLRQVLVHRLGVDGFELFLENIQVFARLGGNLGFLDFSENVLQSVRRIRDVVDRCI